MKRTAITLAFCTFRDKPAVSLRFAKDFDPSSKVKSVKALIWSLSRKCCYIPRSDFNPSEVFDKLSLFVFSDYPDLKSQKQEGHATKSQKPEKIKIEKEETARKKVESFKLWTPPFETDLLEAGADLRYMQELLKRKSSKTMEVHMNVSKKNLSNIKTLTGMNLIR